MGLLSSINIAAQTVLLALLWLAEGMVFARSTGAMVRSMGGRGRLRMAALGLVATFTFVPVLLFWVGYEGLTAGDRIYAFAEQQRLVGMLAVASLILWGWGLWEDRGGGGLHTIAVLWLAQGLLWWAGLRIERLRVPLLLEEPWEFGPVASFVLTLAWLTVIAAVVEWFDSIDGVVLTLTAVAAGALHAVTRWTSPGDQLVLLYTWTLAVLALAMLPFNLPPKPVFVLGKSGSIVLGHWLAALTILARQKGPTAGLLLPVGLIVAILALLMFRFIERSLTWDSRSALETED